jgi:hypothetical protein
MVQDIVRASAFRLVRICRLNNSCLGDGMHKRLGLAAAVLMLFSRTALAQEPQSRVPVVPEKKV